MCQRSLPRAVALRVGLIVPITIIGLLALPWVLTAAGVVALVVLGAGLLASRPEPPPVGGVGFSRNAGQRVAPRRFATQRPSLPPPTATGGLQTSASHCNSAQRGAPHHRATQRLFVKGSTNG